jgi:SAM-dependent methyltransferase
MPQSETWNKEYLEGKLVSKDAKPQDFMKRYFRKFRYQSGKDISEWSVLDLGCGTGRNANYLAQKGAKVIGMEISEEALKIAKERAGQLAVDVDYRLQNIGQPYDIPDASVDVILDITSSNSLNEAERELYLTECHRVLKPGGVLMVRGLLLDGDKNAKNLLKLHPGPEYHTYVMPGTGIIERVFTKDEVYKLYKPFFKVKRFEKHVTYTPFEGQPYKRHFFFVWLIKEA